MSDVSTSIVLTERKNLGVFSVQARKGARNCLAERLRTQLHIELPCRPQKSSSSALDVLGIGPCAWLAIADTAAPTVMNALLAAVGDCASIVDQSDAYVVTRITGTHARDLLSRLVPVDVHPAAFRVNDVRVTFASHIGAALWRMNDSECGVPVFEIAVPRSYARSFSESLTRSTASTVPP